VLLLIWQGVAVTAQCRLTPHPPLPPRLRLLHPGVKLGVMEEQVLSQLLEEWRQTSESVASQLRSAITGLQQDPVGLRSFTLYAAMVCIEVLALFKFNHQNVTHADSDSYSQEFPRC